MLDINVLVEKGEKKEKRSNAIDVGEDVELHEPRQLTSKDIPVAPDFYASPRSYSSDSHTMHRTSRHQHHNVNSI